MSQPLKRKRTEDVDPFVKESRRRVNAFKAEDEAKERIARYRKLRPVSTTLIKLAQSMRREF
jgi:hypothetical protein